MYDKQSVRGDTTTNPAPTEYVGSVLNVMNTRMLSGRSEQLGMMQSKGHSKTSGEPATANAPGYAMADQGAWKGRAHGVVAALRPSSPPEWAETQANGRIVKPTQSYYRNFGDGSVIGQ